MKKAAGTATIHNQYYVVILMVSFKIIRIYQYKIGAKNQVHSIVFSKHFEWA